MLSRCRRSAVAAFGLGTLAMLVFEQASLAQDSVSTGAATVDAVLSKILPGLPQRSDEGRRIEPGRAGFGEDRAESRSSGRNW